MEARRRGQPGVTVLFDLTAGGAVPDTALMQTREG